MRTFCGDDPGRALKSLAQTHTDNRTTIRWALRRNGHRSGQKIRTATTLGVVRCRRPFDRTPGIANVKARHCLRKSQVFPTYKRGEVWTAIRRGPTVRASVYLMSKRRPTRNSWAVMSLTNGSGVVVTAAVAAVAPNLPLMSPVWAWPRYKKR
jgi:hypothetical protein